MSALSPAKLVLALGDTAVFIASLALALSLRHGGMPEPELARLYTFAAPFLMALWLAGFLAFGLYDFRIAKNEPAFFERLGRALVANFALTVLLFYLIPEFGLRPLVTLLVIFTIMAPAAFAWRRAVNAVLARWRKEPVLFIGASPELVELAAFLAENPQLGFVPAGFVARNPANGPERLPGPVFPLDAALPAAVEKIGASRIVIGPDVAKDRALVDMLFRLIPLGAASMEFHRFSEAVHGKIPASLIGEAWFFENLIGARRPRYEFAKRVIDLTLAIILAATALLLLPVIALAVALSTPRDIWNYRKRRAREGDGIVFFCQPRVGRNGRVFDFLKFRSQVLGSEKLGHEKTAGPDPRSYPVGEFLRTTYLDELPQLWNVVKGEMSFVGPRPERPEFVRALEREIPFYRMRELVLPGITGWAQINMENDASVSDAPEKLCYDLYYIKNRSVALDLTILAKTLLTLLARSGR